MTLMAITLPPIPVQTVIGAPGISSIFTSSIPELGAGALTSAAQSAATSSFNQVIASAAGNVVSSFLFSSGYDTYGPRLENLKVTSSTYGAPIPKVYGTSRIAGNIIWARPIKETATVTEVGGKGGGGSSYTTYTYSCSFAVGLCEGPIGAIRRIWADSVLLADFSDTASADIIYQSEKLGITIYTGSETQNFDPTIESFEGVGNTPAYRGLAYIVFDDLQLKEFGNRIPNINVEITQADPIKNYELTNSSVGQEGISVYFPRFPTPRVVDNGANIEVSYFFGPDQSSPPDELVKTYAYSVSTLEHVATYYKLLPRMINFTGSHTFCDYVGPPNDQHTIHLTSPAWYYDSVYQAQTPFVALSQDRMVFCVRYGDYFDFRNYKNERLFNININVPGNGTFSHGVTGRNNDNLWVFSNNYGNSLLSLYRIDYANETLIPVSIGNNFNSIHYQSVVGIGNKAYFIKWTHTANDTDLREYVVTERYGQATELLSNIVQDICDSVSVPQSDVSDLTSTVVKGYVRNTPMSARQALGPLFAAYLCQAAEVDFGIAFNKNDGVPLPAFSIAEQELAAVQNSQVLHDKLKVERMKELDLPEIVQVKYSDIDSDYQVASQLSRDEGVTGG